MASSILPGNRQDVKIHLRDMNTREVIPYRTIHLQAPFEMRIGRGSQTDEHLHPSPWNAWFTSRVMSREHAIVRVDPYTRRVTIQDTGSMHGTYVDGARLEQDQVFLLDGDDKIQLGAEIVRGDQTYKPLELSLRVDWNNSVQSPFRPPLGLTSKNSFSVDYSSDDGNDDIELVYESIRIPSEEPIRQSRTFSVPDSDIEDVEDVTHIKSVYEDDSPPTSPGEVTEVEPKKDVQSSNTANSEPQSKTSTTDLAVKVAGSTVQTALNVSDSEEVSEEDEINGIASEDEEAADYSSEEDHDFLDDDIDSRISQLDNELEEEEEEEEQETFEGSLVSNPRITELQKPTEHYTRRPSPSDCAMPKPSWYQTENLPNIQSLVDQVPPTVAFGDTYSHGAPGFSPFQPVAYCGNMHWPGDSSAPFSGSYDSTFNVHQLPSFSSAVPEFARCYQTMPGPELSPQPATQRETVSGAVKDSVANKTSKVSINDIIEDVPSECASVGSKRKRKAEDISPVSAADMIMWSNCPADPTDVATECEQPEVPEEPQSESADCSSPTSEIQDNIEAESEKSSPSRKLVTFSSETVVIQADLDAERPQKRPKIHHDRQGGSLIKYVASAMAGAALGAVGTVFGLAALPADYFA